MPDLSPQLRADKGWTAKATEYKAENTAINWSKVRTDGKVDLADDAPLTAKIMLDTLGLSGTSARICGPTD
jgi:hypothetical protein